MSKPQRQSLNHEDHKEQRVLSPIEKEEALGVARLKGLPLDWGVEWDEKRQKKIWVSPDGSRRCYSLPQALKYAVKLGQILPIMQATSGKDDGDDGSNQPQHIPLHHRKLSEREVADKVREGRSRGLPEGWTMVWDNMSDQRVWISPDGKKKCKGIPQALRYSVKQGWIAIAPAKEGKQLTDRVLNQEEVQGFLKEAREMGLPSGWNVEWNNAKQKRCWIAPDGCKVHSVPETLRMSLKKGWISKMPNPNDPKTTSEQPIRHWLATCNPTPRPRQKQHVPSGNRQLTESEQLASMDEAKARGLDGGWKAEFCNHLNRRVWIFPNHSGNDSGLRYCSISEALAGIPMRDRMPTEEKRGDQTKKSNKVTGSAKKAAKRTSIPRKAAKRKVNYNEQGSNAPSFDSPEYANLHGRMISKKKNRRETNEEYFDRNEIAVEQESDGGCIVSL